MSRFSKVVSACAIVLIAVSAAQAIVLDVGPGKTYTTIQAAVAASSNFDEIVIYGGTYAETVQIVVNTPPVVTAGSDVSGGVTPLAVGFTSVSSDPGGSVVAVNWDFGDGQTATKTRDKLLDCATDLFYIYGIHAVGLDRLLKEGDHMIKLRHFSATESCFSGNHNDRNRPPYKHRDLIIRLLPNKDSFLVLHTNTEILLYGFYQPRIASSSSIQTQRSYDTASTKQG